MRSSILAILIFCLLLISGVTAGDSFALKLQEKCDDGAKARIDFEDTFDLRKQSFSFSFWIKRTEVLNCWAGSLIGQLGTPSKQENSALSVSFGSAQRPWQLEWKLEGGQTWVVDLSQHMKLNRWHHVVLSFDHSDKFRQTVFVDGLQRGTRFADAALAINGPLKLFGPGINGLVTDVRLWKRAFKGGDASQMANEFARTAVYPNDWEDKCLLSLQFRDDNSLGLDSSTFQRKGAYRTSNAIAASKDNPFNFELLRQQVEDLRKTKKELEQRVELQKSDLQKQLAEIRSQKDIKINDAQTTSRVNIAALTKQAAERASVVQAEEVRVTEQQRKKAEEEMKKLQFEYDRKMQVAKQDFAMSEKRIQARLEDTKKQLAEMKELQRSKLARLQQRLEQARADRDKQVARYQAKEAAVREQLVKRENDLSSEMSLLNTRRDALEQAFAEERQRLLNQNTEEVDYVALVADNQRKQIYERAFADRAVLEAEGEARVDQAVAEAKQAIQQQQAANLALKKFQQLKNFYYEEIEGLTKQITHESDDSQRKLGDLESKVQQKLDKIDAERSSLQDQVERARLQGEDALREMADLAAKAEEDEVRTEAQIAEEREKTIAEEQGLETKLAEEQRQADGELNKAREQAMQREQEETEFLREQEASMQARVKSAEAVQGVAMDVVDNVLKQASQAQQAVFTTSSKLLERQQQGPNVKDNRQAPLMDSYSLIPAEALVKIRLVDNFNIAAAAAHAEEEIEASRQQFAPFHQPFAPPQH